MKKLRQLFRPGRSFKDYLQVVFGSAFGRGVAFLNSIIIARMLGPAQFGMFTLFFAVMVMTWQMSSAFDTTYIRHAKGVDDLAVKHEYVASNLISKTALGLVLIVALLMLDWLAPKGLFVKDYALRMTNLGVIAGLFLNYVMSLANVYREREQFRYFTLITNIHTFIVFVCSMMLLLASRWFSLGVVIGLYLFAAVSVGLWALVRLWLLERPQLPGRELLIEFVAWGKWMFLLSLVFAVFQRIDVLFLTRYLTPEAVGIYSAGVQLVMIISVTTGAMNNVMVPKVVGALESKSSFRAYIKDSIMPVAMIVSIILALMLLAPFLITVLYGEQYASSVRIFRVVSIGWLVACFYMPLSYVYYALDQPKTRFFQELSKLLIGIVLLLILIPRYGALGAALAIMLAMVINTLYSASNIIRQLSSLGFVSLTLPYDKLREDKRG